MTNVIKIGFTGTRKGMTFSQKASLHFALSMLRLDDTPVEFHHGDCLGADKEAWEVARQLGCKTIGHPPIDTSQRAFTKNDEERLPKEYLERNHDIVDETDQLIACPKTDAEERRSGTWATIRYKRRQGNPMHIIYPDGRVASEGAWKMRGTSYE